MSPSSSCQTHEVVTMYCHLHSSVGVVEKCCAVFASSESFQLTTDQVHMVKLPDVRSTYSSIHALDQSANFVFTIFLSNFRWTADVCESLGGSSEIRSADVVVSQFQWFPSALPTNRHHDWYKRFHGFNWWHCRGQLRNM